MVNEYLAGIKKILQMLELHDGIHAKAGIIIVEHRDCQFLQTWALYDNPLLFLLLLHVLHVWSTLQIIWMPLLNESANYIIVCENWSSILSCSCVFKENCCSEFQISYSKTNRKMKKKVDINAIHVPMYSVTCVWCNNIKKSIQSIP